MGTKLAFATPGGGIAIPEGQSQVLGVVDASGFSRIRVVARERPDSTTSVVIFLGRLEGGDGDQGPFILEPGLDEFALTPASEVTRVYDVPGTKLQILAATVAGTGHGTAGIDVLVYGAD